MTQNLTFVKQGNPESQLDLRGAFFDYNISKKE